MEHKMSQEIENASQSDSNEDAGKSNISDNPCGICRASGLPICKGHGGGSGGGGGDSDSKEAEKTGPQVQPGSMLLNVPTPKPESDALFDLLEHSQLWTQTDDFIFQYKNPHALLSMTLNMENNTLSCQGKDDLTKEEQHALDTLFKAMEHEFTIFKKESSTTHPMQANISRIGNQMTINIPDPKYFDAFIQRLVDKNLLVLADKNLLQAQPESKQKVASPIISEIEAPQSEQPTSSWTAPTPFDMTPKPKD